MDGAEEGGSLPELTRTATHIHSPLIPSQTHRTQGFTRPTPAYINRHRYSPTCAHNIYVCVQACPLTVVIMGTTC